MQSRAVRTNEMCYHILLCTVKFLKCDQDLERNTKEADHSYIG